MNISIEASTAEDVLSISVKDDGRGMSPDQRQRVVSPFYTTRTTRKVGMGIPLFKMICEQCEGSLSLESEEGVGTLICGRMGLSHIDRPPLGDMGSTLMTLIQGGGATEFIFRYAVDSREYVFDTAEIKSVLGEELDDTAVLTYLRDMINENIENINGGIYI